MSRPPVCNVMRRSWRDGDPTFGYARCKNKVTRDGMCTRHANLADKQKAERVALQSPPAKVEG